MCKNCREEGHKMWNCPYMNENKKKEKKEDFLSLIKCTLCNAFSHLTRDCPRYKYKNE